MLTALLVGALVLQATISERLGGYAALGLTLAVVMVALSTRRPRSRWRFVCRRLP